jgi:hypothetical protein
MLSLSLSLFECEGSAEASDGCLQGEEEARRVRRRKKEKKNNNKNKKKKKMKNKESKQI